MGLNQIQEITIVAAYQLLRELEMQPDDSGEIHEVANALYDAFPELPLDEIDPEINDDMSDVEADADTLKSVGWGDDSDYGGNCERI
jgi:hypothetical protein